MHVIEAYEEAARAYDVGEFARAREIYEALASEGSVYSLVLLARMCIDGQGAPVDLDRAERLLDQASQLGSEEASLQKAALWLSRGEMRKYFLAIEEAARRELLPAQYQLGVCYARGLGVDKNKEMALTTMRLAAERGHLGAKLYVARELLRRPIDPIGFVQGAIVFLSSALLHLWLASTNPNDDRIR